MIPLPSVRKGLLRHHLDNELLVYDARDDKVHLLDPTTARVLRLLDEPGQTRESIVAELATHADGATGDALLFLSLEELDKAGLLTPSQPDSNRVPDLNRRELVRKITAAGVAALLVPAIATLTATPGYAQASCIAIGSVCNCGDHASCCVGANGGRHCHSVGGAPCACHDT